jgi:hypothetical protein
MCADEGPHGRYFGTSMKVIHDRDAAIAQAQSYRLIPVAGSSYPQF